MLVLKSGKLVVGPSRGYLRGHALATLEDSLPANGGTADNSNAVYGYSTLNALKSAMDISTVGSGSYTGDGTEYRTISLGITPKWVFVLTTLTYQSNLSSYFNGLYFGLATTENPMRGPYHDLVRIVSGGFRISYINSGGNMGDIANTNNSNMLYNYIYGM